MIVAQAVGDAKQRVLQLRTQCGEQRAERETVAQVVEQFEHRIHVWDERVGVHEEVARVAFDRRRWRLLHSHVVERHVAASAAHSAGLRIARCPVSPRADLQRFQYRLHNHMICCSRETVFIYYTQVTYK